MLKLLTIGSELESARRLGLPSYIGNPENYVEDEKNNIIIRWGNSHLGQNKQGSREEFTNVLNQASAIRSNCDKLKTKEKLKKIVSVPKTFLKIIPEGVTAVVRPIEHSSGKEFKIVKGYHLLREGEYGSQYIRTNKEVRVWFCGKSTLMARRVPIDDIDDKKDKCRSNWGYSFCYEQTPINIYADVMKAAKKLNLLFGAADILLHCGEHYILELNSAPSCDLVKLERFYKKNLMRLLQEKFGNNLDKLAEFDKLKKQGFKFAESDF
jgi:predicted ATP-grasp superfamily ATP-dependent carboligase